MAKSLILMLMLVAGCAHDPGPGASTICRNANLWYARSVWEIEASHRFTNPIVFICHGATADGKWTCYPDVGPPMPVEGVAELLHSIYPDRDIVLITCNEDAHTIHVPRVWYATKIVMAMPDSFSPLRLHNAAETGSIWSFRN